MKSVFYLGFILAVALGGCASQEANVPPVILYGKEPCAECHMIIGDRSFAAASVDEEGEVYKFDDIGCLKKFAKRHVSSGQNMWVHDFTSQDLVSAQSVFYVRSAELKSPMGHGVAAFLNQEEAKKSAKTKNGIVLTANDYFNKEE